MLINTRNVQFVIAIAEEGNITKASERLLVAQPSLSVALQKVEAECGVKLFRRSVKGVELTDDGEIFLKYANQAIAACNKLEEIVTQLSAQKGNALVIAMGSYYYNQLFTNTLSEFQAKHPNVCVDFQGTKKPRENVTALQSGKVNIVLTHLSPLIEDIPSIAYRKLFRDEIGVQLQAGDPLVRRIFYKDGDPIPYIDPKELRDQQLIMYSKESNIGQISFRVLETAGITEPNVLFFHQYEPQQVQYDMAAVILPKSACVDYNGIFCQFDTAADASYWGIVAYNKDTISRPGRAFIEMLSEAYVQSNIYSRGNRFHPGS